MRTNTLNISVNSPSSSLALQPLSRRLTTTWCDPNPHPLVLECVGKAQIDAASADMSQKRYTDPRRDKSAGARFVQGSARHHSKTKYCPATLDVRQTVLKFTAAPISEENAHRFAPRLGRMVGNSLRTQSIPTKSSIGTIAGVSKYDVEGNLIGTLFPGGYLLSCVYTVYATFRAIDCSMFMCSGFRMFTAV